MEKTIEHLLMQAEHDRVDRLLDNYVFHNRTHHRVYRHHLHYLMRYGRMEKLTTYQLWKLRKDVNERREAFRHLNTNTNIGEIPMETTIPCAHCECAIEPDDCVVVRDEAYCNDCVFECDYCNEMQLEEGSQSDGNTTVCEDCYCNHYITCEDCDNLASEGNYTSVGDRYICDYCFSNGEYHYCGASGENEQGYESNCGECNEGSDEHLHNYNYKPDPLFHDHRNIITRGALPNTAYFGLELETTPRSGKWRDDAAEYIATNVSEEVLYLKEDSSVSTGFEIVAHPMTLAWSRSNFPYEMLTEISNLGMRAWNDYHCGLHIHISRSAFRSHSHLAKLLLFVYRNESEMVKFTGRNSVDYANYDYYERANFVSRAKGQSHGRRHVAINLLNTDTIELRVFRPSLQPTTVQAYFEFCDALVRYAGTITVEDCVKRNALSFSVFTDWLATQTDEDYSILHARINKRVYATV